MTAMKMYSSFFILGLFVLATTAQNETELAEVNAIKQACFTEIRNDPKNSSKEEDGHEFLRFVMCVIKKSDSAENETEIVELSADEQACMTELGIDPKDSSEDLNQLIPYIACLLKRTGLMTLLKNEDKIFTEEVLSKLPERDRKIVTCLRERGENDNETVEKILNCGVKINLLSTV